MPAVQVFKIRVLEFSPATRQGKNTTNLFSPILALSDENATDKQYVAFYWFRLAKRKRESANLLSCFLIGEWRIENVKSRNLKATLRRTHGHFCCTDMKINVA